MCVLVIVCLLGLQRAGCWTSLALKPTLERATEARPAAANQGPVPWLRSHTQLYIRLYEYKNRNYIC